MYPRTRLAVAASVAAIGTLASNAASASCASYIASYNACTTDSCRQSYRSSYPECFVSGDSASGSVQISGTSVQQIVSISNAVSGRMLALGAGGPRKTAAVEPVTGMAAGNGAQKFNVWGNVTNTNAKYNGNSAIGNSDKTTSHVLNTVVGLDYGFAPNMVVGLSGALDTGRGSANNAGTSTQGYSIAPYFGWQIDQNLALDITTGLGDGKYSTASASEATSQRTFTALNLTYSRWLDNLQLNAKGGYITAKEKYGDIKNNGITQGNTSTSNRLDQFRVGVDAGYWMNGVMPFAGLAYTTDSRSFSSAAGLQDTSRLGKSAAVLSLGVNFFNLGKDVTAGLLYTMESGRSNGKGDSFGGNVSFRF